MTDPLPNSAADLMRSVASLLRSKVGTEAYYTAPETLGRAAIRYFALAIADDNPLYLDDEFASLAGYPSVIAPPTFVCETNQMIQRAPGPDGYIGHMWDLPMERVVAVRGGNDYTFHRPVLPDHRITARWRLKSVAERASSRGVPIVIIVSDVTFTEQTGAVLVENRETMILMPRDRQDDHPATSVIK